MLQPSTLKFLKDLKKNNNKPWFDKNRQQYQAAKKDFENFIQQLIDQQAKNDYSIGSLKAKECLFRINRDIRFSKDKSPYKTNFGASIIKGGKKSPLAGYYFHLEPGASFVGGGIWMPTPENLKRVRQEVDYCFDEFKKILSSKKFRAVYGDLMHSSDIKLSRVPKGYEESNPAAHYIKLKSFVATCKISDTDLLSKEGMKKATAAFEALLPLLNFLNRVMEE
jgi:uncharacterized protein (TIGR02453 family)